MRRLETLSIICGQGGLNASKSPDVARDTDLTAVESITYEDDTWKKDGGATKFNSVAVTGPDPEVRAMIQFRNASVNELVVATRDDRMLVVGSGGITKTLCTQTGSSWRHTSFVEGYDGTQKAIYLFSGDGNPKVYTGGDQALMALGSVVGTVTADNATDTFTRTSHGLANNTRVFFSNSGGALPTGIGNAASTPYWVVNTAANTFQVSNSQGGAAVNFTTNGTGTHTVYRSTMPIDWANNLNRPRWGFLHRGRMYTGGGESYPYDVYVSVLENNNDFLNSGTLFFRVYPGEGDICIGGISWRNKAYLFKYPYGIYVLDDSSTNPADWGWKRISKYVGAISQASIVEADDDVYFVSADGYIHALSAVQESGDVRSSAVKGLEIGPYIKSTIDFSKLALDTVVSWARWPVPQGVYYPTKRKLYFSFKNINTVLSAQGYAVNSVLLGLDLHRSDAGVREAHVFTSTRDQYESFCVYRDPATDNPVLLAGASNGFIYRLDQTSYSKDGAGYEGRFETKDFYPYGGERNANMRELEVIFAPGSSNNTVTIEIEQDGIADTPVTLDDSTRRMRLYGDCNRFKVKGYNSGLNEKFSIVRIDVRYTPGNQRHV